MQQWTYTYRYKLSYNIMNEFILNVPENSSELHNNINMDERMAQCVESVSDLKICGISSIKNSSENQNISDLLKDVGNDLNSGGPPRAQMPLEKAIQEIFSTQIDPLTTVQVPGSSELLVEEVTTAKKKMKKRRKKEEEPGKQTTLEKQKNDQKNGRNTRKKEKKVKKTQDEEEEKDEVEENLEELDEQKDNTKKEKKVRKEKKKIKKVEEGEEQENRSSEKIEEQGNNQKMEKKIRKKEGNVKKMKIIVSECQENNKGNVQQDCLRDGNDIEIIKNNKLRAKMEKHDNNSIGETDSVTSDEQNDTIQNVSKDKQKKKKRKSKSKTKLFPEWLPVEEVRTLLEGESTASDVLVEGYIRIHKTNMHHAYVCPQNDDSDILIASIQNRNRALEGDLVAARVHPEDQWETQADGERKKTGTIVCILERLHSRKAIGHLKQIEKRVLFYPRDRRVPLLVIPTKWVPNEFKDDPNAFENILFLAEITDWTTPRVAYGKILTAVGEMEDVEVESKAILLEHDLDPNPYRGSLTTDLPSEDYILTENDTKDREDWTNEQIFTIDPASAVDLDDAVSCKRLENGNYEIGVHIADVTHFLEFSTPLDIAVAKRATTVYTTNAVYHMLPKQLCNVCSLLPGQERLAFSVIWEMTPEAAVVKHRFVKTVIKSCCQMSYDHAQAIIDDPQCNWPDDFLHVDGKFSVRELADTVNELYRLSVKLRTKRFANGALQIDQPKLHVSIDRNTGLPVSYNIEEQKESNRLIEEFMLLANMTVASHLYTVSPDTTLLRNHREPDQRRLRLIKTMLEKLGVHLNIDTAASLEASLRSYELKADSASDEIESIAQYRMMVINALCIKAMMRATYKCSSSVTRKESLRHYALNVPLYTHFTSPIRRYVDCVVHRLLYSSICGVPLADEWTKELCDRIASNSNMKNYNAKLAEEESTNLYFTYLVSLRGPFAALAVVLEVKNRSMDVILCKFGLKLTIYFADIKDDATVEYMKDAVIPTVKITWKKTAMTQVVNVFTLLYVGLEKHKLSLRLNAVLLPPQEDTEENVNSNQQLEA